VAVKVQNRPDGFLAPLWYDLE